MSEFAFYDTWKTMAPEDEGPPERDPDVGTCRRCHKQRCHLYSLSSVGYGELCSQCQVLVLSEAKRYLEKVPCGVCGKQHAVDVRTETLPFWCHVCRQQLAEWQEESQRDDFDGG